MYHSAEFEIGSLWESRLVKGRFVEIVNVTKTYVIFQPRFLFGEKPSKVRERLTHPAFSKFYVAVKPKSLVDGVAPIERPVSAGSTWENRESSNKVGVMGVYGNRVYVIGVDSDGKWGGIQTDHTLLTFLQLYREVSTTEKKEESMCHKDIPIGSIWEHKDNSKRRVLIQSTSDEYVFFKLIVDGTHYHNLCQLPIDHFYTRYNICASEKTITPSNERTYLWKGKFNDCYLIVTDTIDGEGKIISKTRVDRDLPDVAASIQVETMVDIRTL